jgi:hypothetical protein
LLREYEGCPRPRDRAFFDEGVRLTFDRDALFMKTFCVFRVFSPEVCVGIWNQTLYHIRGRHVENRTLACGNELKAALEIDL